METILSRSKCVKPFVITSLCDTQYLAFHFLGFAMYQTFMSLYNSTWNQYCIMNVAFCIHDWNTETNTTWWRHEGKHSRYWPFVRGIHRCPGSPRTKASDAKLIFFFDLWLNKRLSKQSLCWWFETPSHLLWRHRNKNCATLTPFSRMPTMLSLLYITRIGLLHTPEVMLGMECPC